jgi:ABC-type dipeptide/oligopeptide/nickel transport system permease subunit
MKRYRADLATRPGRPPSARATLGIGLGGAALSVAIGAVLGALAGYLGGAFDALVMRGVDFALAFPSLFAILLITAFFSAGPLQLIVLIGVTGWIAVARLVRGSVRDLKQAPYVDAAHALGAGAARVIWRHLLPNTAGVLFVAVLVQLNRAILTEATISFLVGYRAGPGNHADAAGGLSPGNAPRRGSVSSLDRT